MKKKKQKNCGHKHETFLYLMTEYKNFLTQKEQIIEMSFELNVSNDSSKPEEFSLKDTEVILDNKEQNWFKRAHIGRYLRDSPYYNINCQVIRRRYKISGLSPG